MTTDEFLNTRVELHPEINDYDREELKSILVDWGKHIANLAWKEASHITVKHSPDKNGDFKYAHINNARKRFLDEIE